MRFGLSFNDVLLIPKRTGAKSRKLVDTSSSLTKNIRLHTPILSTNTPWCTESAMAIMLAKLGGIGIIHRMNLLEQEVNEVKLVKEQAFSATDFPNASIDSAGKLRVGAAVGVIGDWKERATQLVAAGVDVLVLDIAHGHADYAIEVVEQLKQAFPETDLIAGNVATAEATVDLISAGADAIKVGIGPGGVCTTRIVTGCGVAQFTAICDCVNEANKYGIPVIADGGIRTSGDITKALAAGANTVMLGSLLAGAEESSAKLVEIDGEKYKISKGFVTLGMQLTLKYLEEGVISKEELDEYVPEGVEATFKYSGSLKQTLTPLIGGLRSGMSYCGSLSIEELHQKAEFMQVSPAGYAEGTPHVLNSSNQIALDYKSLAK